MRPAATLILAIASLLAGCGNTSIQDRVRDEYPDYAAKHGFEGAAKTPGTIICDTEATRHYDGTCTIRPKGFHLTYQVPYRDDKPLWGESHVQ